MSNITLFSAGNVALPDYLREGDELTKALAGSSGHKQISIKGGVWRMIVGGEELAKNEDRAMNFIILAANPHVNRMYYIGEYEEGNDAPPACWSNDSKVPNDEVPAATRQNATCIGCPQNIEGSGKGKSRACRYSRRLAVALENDVEGNIYRLQLPAKSIFGKPEGDKMPLDAYAKFLSGHGVPITGVVTEARFDTSEAVPVLRFRAVRPLTRAEWETCKQAAKSEDALKAIEFKQYVKPETTQAAVFQEPAPAPKAPKAAKPAPAPAPAAPAAVESWDEEEVAEPVVRAAKKPAPAERPVPKDVASVLDQWGDDDDES